MKIGLGLGGDEMRADSCLNQSIESINFWMPSDLFLCMHSRYDCGSTGQILFHSRSARPAACGCRV